MAMRQSPPRGIRGPFHFGGMCYMEIRRGRRGRRGRSETRSFVRGKRACGHRLQAPVRGHQPFGRGHQPFGRGHQPFGRGHQPFGRGHQPNVRRQQTNVRGQRTNVRGHHPDVHGPTPIVPSRSTFNRRSRPFEVAAGGLRRTGSGFRPRSTERWQTRTHPCSRAREASFVPHRSRC